MRVSPLLLLLPAAATAQTGGFDLRVNPALFINPVVQKDLKMTPDQTQKVMGALMRVGQGMVPLANKAGSDPASMRKMQAEYRRLESAVLAPLNATQRARVRQLTLQSIGPSAVATPAVADALKLTPPQRLRISSAAAAATSRMATRMRSAPGTAPDLRRITAAQKASRVEVGRVVDAVLTAPQKARWRAMQGRILPMEGFMGMGGGGF